MSCIWAQEELIQIRFGFFYGERLGSVDERTFHNTGKLGRTDQELPNWSCHKKFRHRYRE